VPACPIAHLEKGGACIGTRLALPKIWADDYDKRAKVRIPAKVGRKTKLVSLSICSTMVSWGLSVYPVLADAGNGDSSTFRNGLGERGIHTLFAFLAPRWCFLLATCPSPPSPGPKGTPGRPRTKWVSPTGLRGGDERARPRPLRGPDMVGLPACRASAHRPRLPQTPTFPPLSSSEALSFPAYRKTLPAYFGKGRAVRGYPAHDQVVLVSPKVSDSRRADLRVRSALWAKQHNAASGG